MKLRRWLSRALVLAMVVALMIPVPVAAKSSKAGGKLVKSYTVRVWRNNRWEKVQKVDFTYDKKGNPTKTAFTGYGNHFLGVPTTQGTSTYTAKYKYKGKSAKSMKERNEAKSVTETRKYAKGKAVNVMSTKYDSDFDGKVEKVTVTDTNTAYTYSAEGLIVSKLESFNETYNDGTKPAVSYEQANYTAIQSKGVPSLIQKTYGGASWNEGRADWFGEEGAGQYNASKYPSAYSLFDGKGLVVEEGQYTDEKAVAHEADRWVVYTMKKGKVTDAVVYEKNYETGAKEPVNWYSFKYAKKSISKVRYLSMINSIVGTWNSEFEWY